MQNNMISNSCAFTGHRPMRFSFKFDESDKKCLQVKAALSEQIATLIANGVTDFYSGMALGTDQWAAETVLNMKKEHPSIRLTAVRPCKTQAGSWTEEQRERHNNTLALCDEVITLHERYTRSCLFERNRYLVDHAGYLLAVYDGGGNGGTAYTIKYAKQQRRWITTIHPDTLAVTAWSP